MSYISSKFLVIVVLVLLILGCSSTQPTAEVAFPVQGITTKTVDGTVPGKTVTTEELRLTVAAAKYNLALAREETRRIEARAEAELKAKKAELRAANPCSSWFMAPSFCYTNGVWNGGVVYSTGTAYGTNVWYGTGGGGHRHTRICRH